MTLSGPEALRSIDDAMRDIRREENDIAKRLGRSAERVAKLREAEAELFQRLAALRLGPEMQGEISGRLSAAETRAREMLKRHAEEMGAAEKELKELDRKIADKAGERTELLGALDRHQSELRALSEKIAQAISRDPDYAGKRREAEDLQRIAAEALRKTEIAERDCEEKARPYRGDPLFMYLWENGYGTRNYKANNLERWLDSKIARMVDYNKARPNFAMLNEIPLRLREHAERQTQRAEAAEAELDALETRAIDAAGGRPVREALETTQKTIEAIDAEMVALEDQRDQCATGLRHLAEGRDPAFLEAVNMLAKSLENEDLRLLLIEARRTATGEDDALVSKIDDTRLRIAEEEDEAREHKARLKTLATRRQELEDIEWEFKKSRYDDPRSTFREDRLAGDLLNDFLRGAITAAAYWDAWQRSQSWRAGTTDWGGGIGLPRSGRSSRTAGKPWGGIPMGGFGGGFGGGAGGFSRPRSGSRGTRKSGGFKTGGGF